MELKCCIVCMVVLAALTPITVHGYRINNDTQVQTPANAIVEVVLEELDADNDGKIAISEVQNRIDGFYNSHIPGPVVAGRYSSELTGYLLTLANLADADASGFIERNEISRFASHLVNLAGDVQVGRLVEYATLVNAHIHGPRYAPESSISQIKQGMDMDNDGQISEAEKGELLKHQRNRWWREEITETFNASDINSDGLLNTQETDQWIAHLSRDYPLVFRFLIVYYRVVALAGRDVANVWAQTRH